MYTEQCKITKNNINTFLGLQYGETPQQELQYGDNEEIPQQEPQLQVENPNQNPQEYNQLQLDNINQNPQGEHNENAEHNQLENNNHDENELDVLNTNVDENIPNEVEEPPLNEMVNIMFNLYNRMTPEQQRTFINLLFEIPENLRIFGEDSTEESSN